MITMKTTLPKRGHHFLLVCLLCRFVAIGISTSAYLLMRHMYGTKAHYAIVVGMLCACVVGAFLYRHIQEYPKNKIILLGMLLEMVAYGIFIVLSGGLSSPYLWYFFSVFMLSVAMSQFRLAALLAALWCIACAIAGTAMQRDRFYLSTTNINVLVGCFVVLVGLYSLSIYMKKLEDSRDELEELNQHLQEEMQKSEQALQHVFETYDTLNLFAIPNPEQSMQELVELLHRSISPAGCFLARTGFDGEILNDSSANLQEEEVEHIRSEVVKVLALQGEQADAAKALEENQPFDVVFLEDMGTVLGVLCLKKQALSKEENSPENFEKSRFYLKLAIAILKKMELQDIADICIVNEEQNRIANEIHDTIIQKLFAVGCNLHLLKRDFSVEPRELFEEQIESIANVVESTMKELREAIFGLRWELEEDTIAKRLLKYLNEVEKMYHVTIDVFLNETVNELNVNQKTGLYRVICESVNNAVRHGNATKISVSVVRKENDILAEIDDNGSGFTSTNNHTLGMGLKNLYRIANLLKGRLSIKSKQNCGVSVCLRISI